MIEGKRLDNYFYSPLDKLYHELTLVFANFRSQLGNVSLDWIYFNRV